ncbi:MAG: gamma-glutamyl-gamma-aminobutyrate hydrolase family protein [Planctomycetia bacterium]|nr:gamma-glutamyl-gamma-aminobutyrate hydrolase family protein [Planctomycetia bacterium]
MVERQKPLIGLNADYNADKTAVSFLFAGYYESVLKAGGIPVIIPPYSDENDLDPILEMLDGVILTGGADVDPRRDGFMLHPSLRLMNEKRENFDRLLISKVYERRLPLFGIGAGMQLLNVFRGGTLYLHISEDLPRALPHRDAMDPYHRHALVVEKDSLFDSVYGDNEIRVNSLHHMSVDDVAPGFLATARCPDGVIEGIESLDFNEWFAFGTQFHPESASATAMDLRIFKEFVEGIIRRSDRFEDLRESLRASDSPILSAPKKKTSKRRRKPMPLLEGELAEQEAFV